MRPFARTITVLELTGLTLLLGGCPQSGSGPGAGLSTATVVNGFNKARGFNGTVFTVAPATGGSGDVYVGGAFSSYNGTGVNRLVRFNADGSIDPAFTVGSGLDGIVHTVATATDGSGDVFVGRDFTTYNSTVVDRLIRLHSDGSLS